MIEAEFPEGLKVCIGLVRTCFLSMSFCVDYPNLILLNTVLYLTKHTSGNIFKMPQIGKNSGRTARPKLAYLLEKVMAENH